VIQSDPHAILIVLVPDTEGELDRLSYEDERASQPADISGESVRFIPRFRPHDDEIGVTNVQATDLVWSQLAF
jgi:hypothetical protein